MTTVVTGAAGFIGYHVCRALLERGGEVIGIDSINDYYSVTLKQDRLAQLAQLPGFSFHQVNIAQQGALENALENRHIEGLIHLAAQAGVRYSLDHPFAYVEANLVGHMAVLECCRQRRDLRHLVYASSSSVYGGNAKPPFSETDRVDCPVSLYAATKRANELLSYSYADLYGLVQTGLRFFTVYGPWGRPDMAMWLFTEAILAGRPIKVFNHGDMSRDFTYVDDIVAGVLAAYDQPPAGETPHRIYNIGNNKPEALLHMIEVLEDCLGRKAERELVAMQIGDVKSTYADLSAIERDLGFRPTTPIEAGIPLFVDWYRGYHGL